jgi:hypothetical protein
VAVTEERVRTLDEGLAALETVPPEIDPAGREAPRSGDRSTPARRPRPVWNRRTWERMLFAAWIAALATLFVFEPAPAASAPEPPSWAVGLVMVFMYAFGAAVIGLGCGARWALGASGVASALGAVIGVACVATEHHAGPWWAVEVAVFAAIGGITALAARRHPVAPALKR